MPRVHVGWPRCGPRYRLTARRAQCGILPFGMAKTFVHGSVGPHDAAGQYDKARRFYLYVVDAGKELDDLVAQAESNLADARVKRPDLVAAAEESLAQAKSVRERVQKVKVETMGVYVQLVGNLIEGLKSHRAAVAGGPSEQAGALDQWDLDFERLQERFGKLYGPFYDMVPGGDPKPLDPKGWTSASWNDYYTRVAGPLLLWQDAKECDEHWDVEGVPPCRGPDYLLAWSLGNQLSVATESDIAYLDPLAAAVEQFVANVADTVKNIVEATAEGLVKIVTAAGRGAARGFGVGPLLLIGGGLLFLATRKK